MHYPSGCLEMNTTFENPFQPTSCKICVDCDQLESSIDLVFIDDLSTYASLTYIALQKYLDSEIETDEVNILEIDVNPIIDNELLINMSATLP